MADKYAAQRSVPFSVLAGYLGIDMSAFKRDERHHEWVGSCPIHGSKTNKGCFRYRDDGLYHCFSEGCKGSGALDLTMAVKQIGFQAAVELLTPLAGQQSASPQSEPINEPVRSQGASGEPPKLTYHKHFQWPCPWLDQRGITRETAEHYGLGWYVNNSRKSAYNGRIMIPFRRLDGVLMGYQGRYIGEDKEQAKYLNPANFPKSEFLFGAAELAKEKTPHKVVFIVESAFTVCKFHQLGFAAVSAYGYSMSESQVRMVVRLARGLVLLPDADKRPEAAGVLPALAKDCWVRYPQLPESIRDPEQLGIDQIRSLLGGGS